MYEIKIKVNGNGTLTTGKSGRLRLGTKSEIGRACLVFDVDSTVEGTYQYVKFVKDTTSYLYRVTSKTHTLNKSILSDAGIWFISFISSKEAITNNKLSGNYAYISEPIEAVVIEGIFEKGRTTEEAEALNTIYSMNFSDLVIPEVVTSIGNYFMYDSRKTFNLTIGAGVKSIGSYTFYKSTINKLTFAENSQLESFGENAMYNLNIESEVVIPASVTTWGKHCFGHTNPPKLRFEEKSKLETLGSYGFWYLDSTHIYLPDNLKTFSGNTYVIAHCSYLQYLWVPNTITTTIPANAFIDVPALEVIELEKDFNVSANFSACTNLTVSALENMLYSLKNLNGTSAKSLTIGATNLAKLNDSQIAIATNKNWTLS